MCLSVALADLDAFFASVEVALRPELSGRPCAVVGGGRGVVLSASYQARSSQVTAGMPVGEARRRCPGLVVVPARLAAYRLCSSHLFSIAARAGGVLEQVSVDEAFWDVTGLQAPAWDEPGDRPGLGACRWLRHVATTRFGLTVSVGLAASKPVAKMACARAKPDGVHAVPCGLDRDFISPMPVRMIPGVGTVVGSKLQAAGLVTVGDLAGCAGEDLRQLVGLRTAERLLQIARAADLSPVAPAGPSKSVSAEVTAPVDVSGVRACDELFSQTLTQALSRLASMGVGARTVTVTHRSPGGRDVSASATLPDVTDSPSLLSLTARGLHARLSSPRLRLVGVSFSSLSESVQLLLDLDDGLSLHPQGPPTRESRVAELGGVAYRGFAFEHPVFGLGTVRAFDAGSVVTVFDGRPRFLDPSLLVASYE